MGQASSTTAAQPPLSPPPSSNEHPPPLSDETDDDSEEDEAGVLLLDKILVDGNKYKAEEEVSIVFFDEEERYDVDEHYLYNDNDDEDENENDDTNDSFGDDFRCFGLPIFSMNFATTVATITSNKNATSSNNNNNNNCEDEDEDPKENIESLQLELKVVDAFYNHHTRNSKKKKNKSSSEETKEEVKETETGKEEANDIERVAENEWKNNEKGPLVEEKDAGTDVETESLRLELQRAEENDYAEHKTIESSRNAQPDRDDKSQSQSQSQSNRSSSFIDLQRLLFSTTSNEDEPQNLLTPKNNGGSSSVSSVSSLSLFSSSISSKNSCRIVELYETRTTQLKPQLEHEKEQVPLERRGVPFRKCRNPSCSCHRPTLNIHRNNKNNRRSSSRTRVTIEPCHGAAAAAAVDQQQQCAENGNNSNSNCNIDASDSSTVESFSQHQKRRSALQKQKETLLAMEYCDDEDDRTEVTFKSSSSKYSGYSIRSDCQINTRKNQMTMHSNTKDDTSSDNNLDRCHRRQHSRSEDLEERFTQGAFSLRERHRMIKLPQPAPLTNSPRRKQPQPQQHRQQQSPPPLPLRRPFGGDSNQKHTTYPSLVVQQGSQSLRKICSESLFDNDINGIPRRCRSEDFIDGSCDQRKCKTEGLFEASVRRSEASKKPRGEDSSTTSSLHASGENRSPSARGDPNYFHGPDIDGKDLTFVRSPTCIMEEVNHNGSYPRSRTTQHEHLLEKIDLIHQQKQDPNYEPTGNRNIVARIATVDDNPCYSRLFEAREENLQEYRKKIRLLLKEKKSDRFHVNTYASHKTLPESSRKQQERSHLRHEQRGFQRAMRLADLYHNMGLIHYQQGRYETARHVLQCGLDALISNCCSCIPLDQDDESTNPFDEDYSNPYFACAPSRLLPLLPTLDEAAPHLRNTSLLLAAELILVQGNILAAQGLWSETRLSSVRVLQWSVFQKQRLDSSFQNQQQHRHHRHAVEQHNKYWKDWGPTIARAQVLFARCCEKERRPDIAMGYYREALSVQKNILNPSNVQAADTLYRMGNLHANSGLLGLAGQCYDEALCLYRHQKRLVQNKVESCLSADEATALAALGWIFLVQNDLVRALALTNEALDGMVRVLGSSHRNVLSLKQQLACIQNVLASPAQYQNRGFSVQAPLHH